MERDEQVKDKVDAALKPSLKKLEAILGEDVEGEVSIVIPAQDSSVGYIRA